MNWMPEGVIGVGVVWSADDACQVRLRGRRGEQIGKEVDRLGRRSRCIPVAASPPVDGSTTGSLAGCPWPPDPASLWLLVGWLVRAEGGWHPGLAGEEEERRLLSSLG